MLLFICINNNTHHHNINTLQTTKVLDRFLLKKYQKFLKEIILKKNLFIENNLKIKHEESFKYLGLQFADLIAGSLFQSLQNNNSHFIDIIKDKISIFDCF
ncbi:hypothetical protein MBCUR_05060 [Methanobrevibacter curvatus]|uniref:Uncharacterized protein n=1 Tax=Methanobrevibacter curvatus TaxID=49547 RepID=A0A166CHH2_9EURY|nr:hypothetical protein MBCUR_05060 [Methanobrevibacter curvatus]